jgi:GT2 family glycosyltransferase
MDPTSENSVQDPAAQEMIAIARGGFFGWLAIPRNESGKSIWIQGWVLRYEGEPVYRVRARAGRHTWPGQYGIPRPDVAAVFPENPSAAFCGFSIDLPLACKSVEVRLEAKYGHGRWNGFYRGKIACGESENEKSPSPLWQILSKALRPEARFVPTVHYPTLPAYHLWFDEPLEWDRLPSRFRLSGWCFSSTGEPIRSIRARIGKREFPGNYGIFRADVATSHVDRPWTFKSGFAIDVRAPRGRALLAIEVEHADGTWEEVFRKYISAPVLNLRATAENQLWKIGDYATWIKRYETLSSAERRAIEEQIGSFGRKPLISIVMPVYNPSAAHLRAAIESVRAQLYPDWELCIVDDSSSAKHVRPLLTRYIRKDSRIKVHVREKNGGIAAASNDALGLTTGEFVALLDDDDVLAPTALYFVALEINRYPEAQLFYSDEDKLDIMGRRGNAHFKPDWNPTLFLAQNFFSHLGVFESELIKATGFRAGFEGSQDYDLVLRCVERVAGEQVRHIPRILYHWRMSEKSAALNFNAKPHARAAAIKAVEQHLARRRIAAEVTSSGDEDFRRIRYALPNDKPRVSIIIATRDLVERLRPCVESILERTTYPNFELLLVDNGSEDAAALSFLETIQRDARVRVLRRKEDFNFGRLNNFAVGEVDSEFVALLNNDLTLLNPDWLEEMVSQGLQSGVGAVGARLLYPDDHIQHAGVILGGGGIAAHAHKGLPRLNHGYFSRAILAQDLSAVTAACMLVHREAYLAVGGFDEEHLRVAFNDVDFCLRLRERGYRIIYTPYAEFYHHESASRGLEDTVRKHVRFEAEIEYMRQRWGEALQRDPAYNPNLSLATADFTLAFPPRLTKSWTEP